jgi:hypothetical protein
VSRSGHIRQFGNDDFLLLEIERHCFTFRTGTGEAHRAPPDRIDESGSLPDSLAPYDAVLVAVQKNPGGFHHLRRLLSVSIKA